MELKTYEMQIDEENIGVYAISLVTDPAIQSNFVLLSENSKNDNKLYLSLELQTIDNKRHVVTGAALIPNQLIYRKDPKTGNEYNIMFTEDTILKVSENFMINNKKDNVTLQHTKPLNNIYLIESWIVDDPNSDKSKKLGIQVPRGTWMVSYKINDDNIWNEYLSNKNILKGFSIEGNFEHKEVHMHNHELTKEIAETILLAAYSEEDLDKMFMWKLGSGEDQCPSCKGFANKIYTLRKWMTLAIPGVENGTELAGETCSFPYSPYGTYCENNCQCQLIRVNTEYIKSRIKKPW